MSDQLPANPMGDFAQRAQTHRRPAVRIEGGYMKFNGKSGDWCHGQEETPVDGEVVIIASHTMQHGFVRWGEKPPAKVFASVADPLPEKPEPFEGTNEKGEPETFYAKDARAISGKFLDEELGQFVYNTDSMGGVERTDELFDAILTKAGDGTPFCYPKVKLEADFYKRSTGKVYKPVFNIIGWCDMNGLEEEATEKLDAPVSSDDNDDGEGEPTPAKPARRRRKVA